MWVSTILAGFAMAPMFPTTVLWVSTYIKITGFVSGLINSGGTVAGLLFPPLVGYLFDIEYYMAVIYFILGNTALEFLLFLGMNLVINFGHCGKNNVASKETSKKLLKTKQ